MGINQVRHHFMIVAAGALVARSICAVDPRL